MNRKTFEARFWTSYGCFALGGTLGGLIWNGPIGGFVSALFLFGLGAGFFAWVHKKQGGA